MNKFLLFYGLDCYPCGGWDDLKGDFRSLTAAVDFAKQNADNFDWVHVVDWNNASPFIVYSARNPR